MKVHFLQSIQHWSAGRYNAFPTGSNQQTDRAGNSQPHITRNPSAFRLIEIGLAPWQVYPSVAEFIPTDPDPGGTRRGDTSPSQGEGLLLPPEYLEPFP